MQLYVNRAASDLAKAVAAAIGEGFDPVRIEWRAPLERDRLREPYDSAFLAAVDLAAIAHLRRWDDRNRSELYELPQRFAQAGLPHDWQASLSITWWAYDQVARSGGQGG